ncbi:MAG: aminotransferase class I/II-fold pyridoxal phosphate-dependent enzyme [Lachnospiraceae bacterium]|nr:aminotransferase class I/II-fold pyridoxal phosphate-dependent enzyme [Lachnospiraceae bacterium]
MINMAIPNLTGNEKKYLDNCIDSTFVSSVGEYVNCFEKMVADSTGSMEAVATSCGTTGIHAALTAVGVSYNDLVIIPSFTFIATANAIHHCGAEPWLMEINKDDWCIDPFLVKRELATNCEKDDSGALIHKPSGKRVAAIMPVYTLGNIPNMHIFNDISKEYGVPLIVDAACAIGAKFEGEDFGKLADLSILSFNGNKTVTCGGGGAVVGNNDEMLQHVRHLTTTARVWPDYDFDEPGFNYRMTNIQAGVGVAQMERLNDFVAVKRKVRKYYQKAFSGLQSKGIGVFPTTDGASCWFSGIVMPEGSLLEDSKAVCSKLKDAGIEARTFWKPIHLQKPYANCPKTDTSFTDLLWQRIITLPCSTNISDEDLSVIDKTVNSIFS